MYAVLSWLKGLKGAHYAEMELKMLTDGKLLHWYWELFATEIEGVFHPQLQQDWAHNVLKKLKQTDNMSMVAFITEFMKLKYYAKTNDGAAIVKDASLTRTYSFLPASWAGDAHKETDFLPIGDREEREEQCLNRRTDSLEAMRVLMAKYLRTKVSRDWIASSEQQELA